MIMDTQKLATELLATGLTQSQLAELVPCSQSLIAALVSGARGKQTSFVIASRLQKLHAARCKHPQKQKLLAASEEESNEEIRRECDLGYRQPADPKKVDR